MYGDASCVGRTGQTARQKQPPSRSWPFVMMMMMRDFKNHIEMSGFDEGCARERDGNNKRTHAFKNQLFASVSPPPFSHNQCSEVPDM